MCTIPTASEAAAGALVVMGPTALTPLALAAFAWRRPTRRAAVAAAVACAAGGAILLLMIASASGGPPPSPAAQARARWIAPVPGVLGGAALLWGAAAWRPGDAWRHGALLLAALGAAAMAGVMWSGYATAAEDCAWAMRPPPSP